MRVAKNPLITDNVHGEIHLSELERELIRTQTFTRLGHIKELGLAHHVFPGATHTRLSHSLGCMHIVGKIAGHLRLGRYETRLLRLAGLLHDVGQYPLSHVMEAVYRQIAGAESQAYVKNVSALKGIEDQPLLWRAAVRPPGTDAARDKALARTVILQRPDIRQVFKRNKVRDDEIEHIASIIAGRHLDTLYGHLLDSDYDCDRFDYILRDSHCAGVSYGLIELDYLIENMSVVSADASGSSDRVLAVNRRRALHALEHYLTARYFLYSQVIYHKTVRSLELLAKAVLLAFAERGITYSSFKEIEQAVPKDQFILFDDSYFYEKLRHYWAQAKQGDSLRGIVERVLFRRPLPLIREFRCFSKEGEEPKEYTVPHNWLTVPDNLRTLANDAGLPAEQIVVEEVSIDMVPIGSEVPFELVLRQDEEKRRAVIRSPRLFDDESGKTFFLVEDEASLLRDLAGKHLCLLRVYLNNDDRRKHRRLRRSLQVRTAV